mmetsp:Transcript_1426/g.4047  ORF Transcript_1426/g.4047 Transcript_1426/m.4047 type:complete len:272 (+) Transcript_1426:2-817(+)
MVPPTCTMGDISGGEAVTIEVSGDGQTARLSAIWFEGMQEETHSSFKVAVLAHGFVSDKTESGLFFPAARRLAAAGISTVAYDWRGRGESEGDFARTSLDTHIADFGAVCSWATARVGCGPHSLVAVGFSLGSVLVVEHATRGGVLGAAIGWSPAFRPALDMWPRYDIPELHTAITEHGAAPKPGGDSSALIGKEVMEYLRTTDCGENALERILSRGCRCSCTTARLMCESRSQQPWLLQRGREPPERLWSCAYSKARATLSGLQTLTTLR